MSASLAALSPQVQNSRNIMIEAQDDFLRRGGGYQLALVQLRAAGIIQREYVFHEYPKVIRISHGFEEHGRERETETCKGTTVRWTEKPAEIIEEVIVASEEEEERVLAGGKTSSQMEEERQGLLVRARSMGVPADPTWSAVRLRRELGEALDAPAPGDSMARLEAELAGLRKMAAMQAEIEALRAQLANPESPAPEPPIEELGDKKRGKAA